MHSFQYRFVDQAGRTAVGSVLAGSEAEAMQILHRQGISNAQIVPSQIPPKVAPPDARPFQSGEIKTKRGTDRQLHFLFAQISQQLKAGIAPNRVFHEIGAVTSEANFRQALAALSTAATNGQSLADTMAQFPYLFPEGAVGTVRAGEAAGFLPDAFRIASEQAKAANSFKRWHWFVPLIVIYGWLAVPTVFLFRYALLEGWHRAAADQEAAQWGFTGALLDGFKWPFGPLILLGLLMSFLMNRWLSSRPMTLARHRIGLNVPFYGDRARNENIAHFSWVLGQLSKAGIYPKTAWALAASSVPNLEMAERLRDAGARMTDNSRISQAVFESKLFPRDYAPMLTTGELTGNIAGALEHLEHATREDYNTSTKKAMVRSASFGCTALLIIGGILLIVMVKAWYGDFYSDVLKEFQVP